MRAAANTERAEVIDGPPTSGCAGGRRRHRTAERHDADREVDEEDPMPADRVGEEPAQRGAEIRRSQRRPEQTLVLPTLPRAEEVADDRQGDREDGTRAQSLDATEGDELAIDWDSPARSDPTRNRLTPNMIIGLRPNWSDSLP